MNVFSMLDRLAKFSETLEPSFDNMQLIPGMGDSNLYVFQDLGRWNMTSMIK